jgi:hypothetical protein
MDNGKAMNKVNLEANVLAWLLGSLAILFVSSLISLTLGHSALKQIVNLLHPVAGIIFSISTCIYVVLHFTRIFGYRRFSLFVSGIFIMVFFGILLWTGWQYLLQGSREEYEWQGLVHLIAGYLVFSLSVLHIILHKVTFPARRQQEQKFKTLFKFNSAMFYGFGTAILSALLLWSLDKIDQQPYLTTPAIDDYQYNYASTPFRPSETTTTDMLFVDARAMDTTAKCASCHQDIAKQWYSSAHRQAASDKSYETNILFLAKNKGIEATRYCEGCHAPLALLTGQLTPGGEHGGISGSLANLEGINCQSCHGISEVIHTKGVASYQFDINQPYMFETANHNWLKQLNKMSIQLDPEQHKRDMAPEVLGTAKYCATCHAQFIDKEVNDWGWVKMQDEYSAWLDSPYSGQQDGSFSHTQVQNCQDCHMPKVPSNDPSADKNGLVRDHRFLGANTMLPTLNGDKAFFQATKQFLQSNKVRISIEPPHRKDATTNNMPINRNVLNTAIQPFYFYKGETASLNVIVANSAVGHNFPGGTIDINQVWVAIQVKDAEGQEVFSSGDVGKDEFLDPDAYNYRSLPVDRNGQIVWRHDLFNMVGKASVNVIKAGESDVVDYQFKVPYWAKSPLAVSAQIRYRKLNTRYAKWALQDEYVPLPIVDLDRAFLHIPVRDKIETIDNNSKDAIAKKIHQTERRQQPNR